MMKRWVGWAAVLAAVVPLTIGSTVATAAPSQSHATNITLQLKWVPQAQFAGYYAAVQQGYYKAAGLDVKLWSELTLDSSYEVDVGVTE